jgi:hypothetical protein
MKKPWFVFLVFALVIASCNMPGATSTETPIESANTAESIPTATDIASAPSNEFATSPAEKLLQLDHHPLYWFAPLPPLSVNEGRPFIGSEDFMTLFNNDADWHNAVEHIQVFKLYGEWVAYQATDEELRIVIENLKQRGLALAVEAGPLNASAECGQNIEGFAGIEEGIRIANRIKNAGGKIHLIGMDEPYYYGHFYEGANACHWSAEKIASEINIYINETRKIFPEVIIGDTEPLAGPADAKTYQDWMDIFREVNGYDLAFLHMDIDWSRPTWSEEVKSIDAHGKEIGIPVGIIYTGNSFDKSDEDWLSAAGERVKKHEIVNGGSPDHVLFQSWNDKPDFSLPDSKSFTFTGFINFYFKDKEKLGFPREGAGENLALNKPVRVSNLTEDSIGTLAVDGDLGTLWSSGGDAPQWIEIDLNAEHNISEIQLTPSQFPEGHTIHNVKGKGAGAGDLFVLLYTFDGNTKDGNELTFLPDAPLKGVRYIRIETIASPSWVAWREIKVIDAGE